MYRMEVRCCCQPEKLLGTLPVPDRVRRGQVKSIAFPITGKIDWDTGRHIPQSSITFAVERWATIVKLTPDSRKSARRFSELEGLAEMDGGLALKHENVTIETLRRIPGFLEAT